MRRFRRRAAWGAGARSPAILKDLAAAGRNVREAGELLAELFSTWPDDSTELRARISVLEHEGDELTRSIVHALHRSKASAFDRGSTHALAEAIDDVVDDIEEAAEGTAIYRIEAPLEQAEDLASVLRDAAAELGEALARLGGPDEVEPCLQRVRTREREGDRIYREALADLFDGGIDPLLIIRWKDVLTWIEEAIDRCRNAADILAGLLLEHE